VFAGGCLRSRTLTSERSGIVSKDSLDDLSSLVGQDVTPGQRSAALERSVQWRSIRLYFRANTWIALLVGLLLLLSAAPNEPLHGLVPPAIAGSLSLLGLLSMWKLPGRSGRAMMMLMLILAMGLAVSIAVSRQLGLHAISMAALGMLVALGTSFLGLRNGLILMAVGLLALAGLSGAELSGTLIVDHSQRGLVSLLIGHSVLLALGLGLGLGSLRMVKRSVMEATERNSRFRDLLSMAADWYWEMDREYRFTHVSEDKPGASGLDLQGRIGKAPWEIESLGLSVEEMDAHRADLESHRPFHGMVARRLGTDGDARYVSVSGEPRFDAQGNFRGYWGVGRDVTHEVQAERAVHATETRYRELFRRSPSPLVLHRWGRVLDANPAAMAMFGYTQRSSMIGQDLFSHYEPGDDERGRQRTAKIEAMAVGAMLPMAEFRLRTLSRRARLVTATSVRVDATSGPATLSFFIDQTEASRAQDALRRSEGLLSHLEPPAPM